jgi:hypothetical protein
MRKAGNLTATACPGHNLQAIVDAYRGSLAMTTTPSAGTGATSHRVHRPASAQ